MSESYEELLGRFLNVLGKEECPETEEALRHHFGLYPQQEDNRDELQNIWASFNAGQIDEEELDSQLGSFFSKEASGEQDFHIGQSKIVELGMLALNDLRYEFPKEKIDYLGRFLSNPNKKASLEKLNKKVEKLLEAFKSDDVQEFFMLEADLQDDGYLPFQKDLSTQQKKIKRCRLGLQGYVGRMRYYKGLYDRFFIFSSELDVYLQMQKRGKKRPSLNRLSDFVYEVAQLYQELSGHPFTVDKHPDPVEGHSPLTKGMEFVWVAMDWLHAEAKDVMDIDKRFVSKSIANACDKARTKIRESKKNNCVKNNKK